MAAVTASTMRSSSHDCDQDASSPAELADALSTDSLQSESDESCDTGVDIDLSKEFTTKDEKHSSRVRTAKPIRVRVRWSCHRCQGQVDKNKVCIVCQHARCDKCVRDPPLRRNSEDTTPPPSDADLMADVYWNPATNVMQRPSRTGGQDLVHRPPRQMVRRTCHLCQANFERSKRCVRCGHPRCSECPRDPENKEKYPYGYPGDEYSSDSIPYYECLRCCEVYAEDAEYGTPCQRCGCGMSRESPRVQPRAVLAKPNAPLLESIQQQLTASEA